MSLRNKIAILSATLMSLMTIPTLADDQPVTSRIESANFNVQINTPEGWIETKDFTSIPETLTLGGENYRGIQFKNDSEFDGCVMFFSEDSDDEEDNDDDDLLTFLGKAQEIAFPGSAPFSFVISKITTDGNSSLDIDAKTAQGKLRGTLEGTVTRENGDSTKATIAGSIQYDSTKENVIVGTGSLVTEGGMPIKGTIGILTGDDYEVIVAIWGTDEESQIKDAYCFLEAVTVKAKAPVETVAEADVIVEADAVDEATSDPVVEVVEATLATIEST